MYMAASAHAAPYPPPVLERTKFGMWLFLASEVMFFTGFLGAYTVYKTALAREFSEDQHHLNTALAAFNTLALILSSLTMALAVGAAHRGEERRLRTFLLATILLGCVFLVVKSFEYSAKFGHQEVVAAKDLSARIKEQKEYGRKVILAAGVSAGAKTFAAGEPISEGDAKKIAEAKVAEVVIRAGIFPSTSVFYACYFTLTGFHGLHVIGGIIVLVVLWIRALRGAFSGGKYLGIEMTGLYWHFVDIVWIFLFPVLYLLK